MDLHAEAVLFADITGPAERIDGLAAWVPRVKNGLPLSRCCASWR
jgi:hypothetical protein